MELFQDISNQQPKQQPVLKTFERRRRVVSAVVEDPTACGTVHASTHHDGVRSHANRNLAPYPDTVCRQLSQKTRHQKLQMQQAHAAAAQPPAQTETPRSMNSMQLNYLVQQQGRSQCVADAAQCCVEQRCLGISCSAAVCRPLAHCCWPKCQKQSAKHTWRTHSRWQNTLQRYAYRATGLRAVCIIAQ